MNNEQGFWSADEGRAIGDMPLSIRTENRLIENGVRTIGDLRKILSEDYARARLARFKGMGKRCLDEIESVASDSDLTLSPGLGNPVTEPDRSNIKEGCSVYLHAPENNEALFGFSGPFVVEYIGEKGWVKLKDVKSRKRISSLYPDVQSVKDKIIKDQKIRMEIETKKYQEMEANPDAALKYIRPQP